MPDGKPMRRDAQRSRDAIITAARLVFDAGESIRFDDFAARAGVGVGTLYRHFPTRETLAAAVYTAELSALCTLAGDSSRPPHERLDEFIHSFVAYLIEHSALARALSALVDPSTQAAGGSEIERTLSSLMLAAAKEGTIRDDVGPGAVLVAFHGIGSASDRPEWATEARDLAALIIQGLRVPKAAQSDGMPGRSPRPAP
ncbi:TetR/AcrR family transcriptional regulator [Arthrobacter gandavensis]|uniref:TetR/AcrR family transcriptional regulator n=1 Tax=Arthrobacter gandavensis TaxID=169960 RepID=UPI00188DE98A|nr:TetR/AcrR family transcriptional regulator [Arthrobacter gandavensis]MBF4994721.1 TetR/AcrR family transcriptional regulator [Arthrobacter gandavensis]